MQYSSVKVKRGTSHELPESLELGEVAFTTNLSEMWVGMGIGQPLKKVEDREVYARLLEQLIRFNKLDASSRKTTDKIKAGDLATDTDSNKIKLANLSQEVINSITGNASVTAQVGDKSLTSSKYGDESIPTTALSTQVKLFIQAQSEQFEANQRVIRGASKLPNMLVDYSKEIKNTGANPLFTPKEVPNLYHTYIKNQGGLYFCFKQNLTKLQEAKITQSLWINTGELLNTLDYLKELATQVGASKVPYLDFYHIAYVKKSEETRVQQVPNSMPITVANLRTLGYTNTQSSAKLRFDFSVTRVVEDWSALQMTVTVLDPLYYLEEQSWYLRFCDCAATPDVPNEEYDKRVTHTIHHIAVSGDKINPTSLYLGEAQDFYSTKEVDNIVESKTLDTHDKAVLKSVALKSESEMLERAGVNLFKGMHSGTGSVTSSVYKSMNDEQVFSTDELSYMYRMSPSVYEPTSYNNITSVANLNKAKYAKACIWINKYSVQKYLDNNPDSSIILQLHAIQGDADKVVSIEAYVMDFNNHRENLDCLKLGYTNTKSGYWGTVTVSVTDVVGDWVGLMYEVKCIKTFYFESFKFNINYNKCVSVQPIYYLNPTASFSEVLTPSMVLYDTPKDFSKVSRKVLKDSEQNLGNLTQKTLALLENAGQYANGWGFLNSILDGPITSGFYQHFCDMNIVSNDVINSPVSTSTYTLNVTPNDETKDHCYFIPMQQNHSGSSITLGYWLKDSDVDKYTGLLASSVLVGVADYPIRADAKLGVKYTSKITVNGHTYTREATVDAKLNGWTHYSFTYSCSSRNVTGDIYFRLDGLKTLKLDEEPTVRVKNLVSVPTSYVHPFSAYTEKHADAKYVSIPDYKQENLTYNRTCLVKPEVNNLVKGLYAIRETKGTKVKSPNIFCNQSTAQVNYVANPDLPLYNTIQVSHPTGEGYTPTLYCRVTRAELEEYGIIPNDETPPLINMRGGFTHNFHKDTTNSEKSGHQIFFLLRYSDSLGSNNYVSSTDVLFTNGVGVASWLGTGDTIWNHPVQDRSGAVTSCLNRGYIHKDIPLLATYKGKPLQSVAVCYVGRTLDGPKEVSFETAYTCVTDKPLTWSDSCYNIPDDYTKVDDSTTPEEDNTAVTNKHVLDVKSADKVVLFGDSFTACHYTLAGKAYINNLSLMSEYNFENFARSGDDYAEINTRVQKRTPEFHDSISVDEFGGTYAVMLSHTNDGYYRGQDMGYYYDNLEKLMNSVKGMGMLPIVCTEHTQWVTHDERNLRGLTAIADKHKVPIIDMATESKIMHGNRYAPFWGSGHPATRTTYMMGDPIQKGLDTLLPRPNKSLKIFRKRNATAFKDINELMTDTLVDRATKFKEIMVGHYALSNDNRKYYDDLDKGYAFQKVISEYLKLQNKEQVLFDNYALIEAIIPSTSKDVERLKLKLDTTDTIKVYYRSTLPTSIVDTYKYTKFVGASNDISSISVGDTYKDSAEVVFTVKEVHDTHIVCSPHSSTGRSNLTKVKGNGVFTLNVSSKSTGLAQSWFNAYQKPQGEWKPLELLNGYYEIPVAEIENALVYDKVQFLVEKTDGFKLRDVSVEWYGTETKDNRQTMQGFKIPYIREELVPNPLFTTMDNWVVTGSIAPFTPFDNCLPRGTSKCVTVDSSNTLKVSVSMGENEPETRTAYVRVWARNLPPKHSHTSGYTGDNSPITEDTFDQTILNLVVSDTNTPDTTVSYEDVVGLHWKEVVFKVVVPNYVDVHTFELKANRSTDIARVSIKVQ